MFSLQGLHEHRELRAEDEVQGGLQPELRQVPQAAQCAGPAQQAVCSSRESAQKSSERQQRIQGE